MPEQCRNLMNYLTSEQVKWQRNPTRMNKSSFSIHHERFGWNHACAAGPSTAGNRGSLLRLDRGQRLGRLGNCV